LRSKPSVDGTPALISNGAQYAFLGELAMHRQQFGLSQFEHDLSLIVRTRDCTEERDGTSWSLGCRVEVATTRNPLLLYIV